MGGHLKLPVLTTESDDHYLKYVNLRFVHLSTITYDYFGSNANSVPNVLHFSAFIYKSNACVTIGLVWWHLSHDVKVENNGKRFHLCFEHFFILLSYSVQERTHTKQKKKRAHK